MSPSPRALGGAPVLTLTVAKGAVSGGNRLWVLGPAEGWLEWSQHLSLTTVGLRLHPSLAPPSQPGPVLSRRLPASSQVSGKDTRALTRVTTYCSASS